MFGLRCEGGGEGLLWWVAGLCAELSSTLNERVGVELFLWSRWLPVGGGLCVSGWCNMLWVDLVQEDEW